MSNPLGHILRSATDPLKTGPDAGRELATRFGKTADGFSREHVLDAAVSVLLDVIRQSHPNGERAHVTLSAYAEKMHALLDLHYDPITGRRRAIFAHDQVIRMNFTDDGKRD